MANRGKSKGEDRFEMYEGFEWQSTEFVKWRKIWIAVNAVGFGLSAIAFFLWSRFDDKMPIVIMIIVAMFILFFGAFLDKTKVTKLRNIYTMDPGIDLKSNSRSAVAARKAEVERIEKALEEERQRLAAKKKR